jgi:pimeloyl-ACP methyl ester carboxylesterase
MTEPAPGLVDVATPRRAASVRAVALVLHGGRDRSMQPVRANQLAVLRMVPIARRLAAAGHGELAVIRLRFGVRGWNGAEMSPVRDAGWALEQLAERYPGRPIGLLGHSMGARTALRIAGQAGVHSVAGFAPWLPPEEPASQLRGRRVLLAHGDQDRVTSAASTARFAERLRAEGVAASFVSVRGDGHAMLRRASLWHELAVGFLIGTLLPDEPQSGRTTAPNYLPDVIRGVARITI